ncbi:hypothetical protein J1605_020964 [Eschrichtius robustus]|uniref:Uncharacterized protein n=1 Tax=Eschrichtius robustus TaxID=9764 RepID=A0AB34HIP5_ESCRO|nr:hypothetical protein J1605_020964 [Eschrichtius robustus]
MTSALVAEVLSSLGRAQPWSFPVLVSQAGAVIPAPQCSRDRQWGECAKPSEWFLAVIPTGSCELLSVVTTVLRGTRSQGVRSAEERAPGRLIVWALVRNGGGQHWSIAGERGQFAQAGDEEGSEFQFSKDRIRLAHEWALDQVSNPGIRSHGCRAEGAGSFWSMLGCPSRAVVGEGRLTNVSG